MTRIFWQMSFTDTTDQTNSRWLGGINTEAPTLCDAITWTHLSGLNPGGELAWYGYTATHTNPHYLDRLITDISEWENQPRPLGQMPLPEPLPPEFMGTPPEYVTGLRFNPAEPGQE
ncbi:MAG: hypothetical protein ACREQ5_00080 [Candidatus Dormibacteria bacterium]